MRRVLARAASIAVVAATANVAPAFADDDDDDENLLKRVRVHQQAFHEIGESAGGNRFAGLEGHDDSAAYVKRQLERMGYKASYHEFVYRAFFEREPSQMSQSSPAATAYVNGVDFRIMSYSGSGNPTGELAAPSVDSRGCSASDWGGASLAGKVAIVQRGICTFRIKANAAYAQGAAGVLVYNNVDGMLNGTLGEQEGLDEVPVFGLPKALGESLKAQMAGGAVSFTMKAVTGVEDLPTRNVIAETRKGNPDNVVMVGAHLDSVTAGPGINDNGSGSAAILEAARLMKERKTTNRVRFAWWSAEESGLVGATRWVGDQSAADLDKIAMYLNFDMVGSPNYGLFVYDGDNSKYPAGENGVSPGPEGSAAIESTFYGFFEREAEMAAEPTPFNGRSDYGPFIAKGIPAGGLFTGAEQPKTAEQVLKWGGTAGLAYDPCYHAACDNFGNNADRALEVNSEAIAYAVTAFARSTQIVNGAPGKGKPPYQGGADGQGTGSGGGLHDGHHDEPA
jgi:Zn-dependent M28 family amino/carboxypeptidase